jgi:hypothetical protein
MTLLVWLLSAALAADDRDRDNLVDALDQCPDEAEDERGFQTFLDGCPRPFDDHDGDGFADVHDACKYEPEPKRVQGLPDGCPMKGPDTDRDGIADMYDRCPEQAEDFHTLDPNDTTARITERLDGCPLPTDPALAVAPPAPAAPAATPTVAPVTPLAPAALPLSGETPFGSCTGRVVDLPRNGAGVVTLVFACDGKAPRAFRTGDNLVVPTGFPPAGSVGDLMWSPGPGTSDERVWSLFTIPPDGVWKPVHYADQLVEGWD